MIIIVITGANRESNEYIIYFFLLYNLYALLSRITPLE